MNAKEIIQALTRAGFYIHHQKGSHVQLRHEEKLHLRVTVPYHVRFDLPPSVVRSILHQAEITPVEFLKLR